MNSFVSNQPEHQYRKNPIKLEKLTYFRVLETVPVKTAHLQDMDAALNALGADIGSALDRVCGDLYCIMAQLTFYLI